MTQIALVSDTHGHIDDELFDFFSSCDEIWHAGDIGNYELIEQLAAFKPVRAVYGNIDGQKIRAEYPEDNRFRCEKARIWIRHIGGYPNRYDKRIREQIKKNPPDLFISGHSHILKVMYDQKLDLLHINPGAYGLSGFHKVRTAVRFRIDEKNFKDLEVLEIPRS